ncbi:MAG: hypothetical protein K8L99_00905 [Anaerolineae bacterium]|nr:hypothetical protein [Anaerolineae bacterium]
MPRSTRILVAIILWTVAGFIAVNNLVAGAGMNDWWLPIILFIIGLLLLLWPTAEATEAADYTEEGYATSASRPAVPTQPEAIAATTAGVIPSTPEPPPVHVPERLDESDEVVLTSRPLEAPASVEPTMNTLGSRSVMQDEAVESPAEAAAVEARSVESQAVRKPLSEEGHVEAPEPEPEERSEATETNQNVNTSPTVKAVEDKPVVASSADGESLEEAEAETDENEPMTEERSDAIAATVTAEDAEEEGDSLENINTDEGVTLEETGEVSGPPGDSISRTHPTKPDDLKRIEGIGKKMSAALIAAGIDTFEKLAASSEEEIRAAIDAAGMRFAPSVPTWAKQAEYAARDDWDGLKAYQDTLTAGRAN